MYLDIYDTQSLIDFDKENIFHILEDGIVRAIL